MQCWNLTVRTCHVNAHHASANDNVFLRLVFHVGVHSGAIQMPIICGYNGDSGPGIQARVQNHHERGQTKGCAKLNLVNILF